MINFFANALGVPPEFIPVLQSIAWVWGAVWWIVLPIISALFFWEAWLIYLHYKFAHAIRWKLLEIKVPKNVLKTPKAMEQIFAAAHAPYSYGIRFFEKYFKGTDEYWMSFELVGRAGESHFYLRVPAQFRNMMESAIYGQYPEAEITEVPDYIDAMPRIIPNEEFDVSGFDEILRHPNYLPIRTYPMFEESVEERRVDTIGPIMEIMSKLKEDEQIWFQLIIRPTGEEFKKEGEEVIRKMYGMEEKEEKNHGWWPGFTLGFTFAEALKALFVHPGEHEIKEKREKQPRFMVSSTEKDIADAINLKIAKIAFEATPRFLYIKKNSQIEDSGHIMSLHGYMRQFNTQHLNSLKPDSATTTASYTVRGLFKKMRLHWRKRAIYEHYVYIIPHHHHQSVLNIEELATIFHFPIAATKTTELEKIESRKGSPPSGLPIIEDQ